MSNMSDTSGIKKRRARKTPPMFLIKWWRSVTERGYLDAPGVWPAQIQTNTLADLFLNSEYYRPGQSTRSVQTSIGFLMSMVGAPVQRPLIDGCRVRTYTLPTLEECRENAAAVLPDIGTIDGKELPKRQIDQIIRERATVETLRDALRRIIAVSGDPAVTLGMAVGAMVAIASTAMAATKPGQAGEA
jgi:hypothetical protein